MCHEVCHELCYELCHEMCYEMYHETFGIIRSRQNTLKPLQNEIRIRKFHSIVCYEMCHEYCATVSRNVL